MGLEDQQQSLPSQIPDRLGQGKLVATDKHGNEYLSDLDWHSFPDDLRNQKDLKQWMEAHGFAIECVRCHASRLPCNHLWPCKACTDAGVPCLLVRPALRWMCDCGHGVKCLEAHGDYLLFLDWYYRGQYPENLKYWSFPGDPANYPGGTKPDGSTKQQHQAPEPGIAKPRRVGNPAGFEGQHPPWWVCETFHTSIPRQQDRDRQAL